MAVRRLGRSSFFDTPALLFAAFFFVARFFAASFFGALFADRFFGDVARTRVVARFFDIFPLLFVRQGHRRRR
jgi:hypothetical protein